MCIIFLLIYFGLKFILKELGNKFIVDFLPKDLVYYIKNIKFIDLFLNNINSKGFSLFSLNRGLSNLFIKSLNYNSLVVIIIIIFLIF